MALVCAAAACADRRDGAGASRVPNPPFLGQPPEEAYVYKGPVGLYGGGLVTAIPDEPHTFNIIRATETASADVLWVNVFRCLVDYRNGDDPPGYDPGVCTRWDTSEGGKEWTFHIRKGVKWSDGEPFSADDVVFTYNVVLDEKVDTPIRDTLSEGKDASGRHIYPELEKLDDYTVRFKLHKVNESFLDAIFNLFLIPKHKWEQAWLAGNFRDTMKTSDDPSEIVGLGPYRIKERVSGQRVVLERNPYFWKVDTKGGRLPYLDRIVFVIQRDFNTVQSQFEAGNLDIMSRVRATDFALVKRLESAETKVQEIGVSYDTYFMAFNLNNSNDPATGKPYVTPWKQRLFRNQKFRQAVSYAIDREGLANTAFAGRGVPIYSCVTPADKVWYSDDIMKYPYDPARARQLLAEIGLTDTNGDGILEDAEGHPVEFNIVVNASNSQRVDTATFISNTLREVGLRASPAPTPLGQIAEMTQTHFNFDAVVLGWQINPPPGPVNSANILLSSGENHMSFPSQKHPSTEWEEEIDRLYFAIPLARDQAERKKLYGDIQRIWSEQLPEINLIAEKVAVAYKNKFGNLYPTALQPRVTWNAEEIYTK